MFHILYYAYNNPFDMGTILNAYLKENGHNRFVLSKFSSVPTLIYSEITIEIRSNSELCYAVPETYDAVFGCFTNAAVVKCSRYVKHGTRIQQYTSRTDSFSDLLVCIRHHMAVARLMLNSHYGAFANFGYFDTDMAHYINNDVTMTNSIYRNLNRTTSIKNVIFNDPATIVFWSDGTKTVVKTQCNEFYDPEKGLAMAISKKVLGNKGNYYNTFKKWLPKSPRLHLDMGVTAIKNLPNIIRDHIDSLKKDLGI